MSAGGQWNAWEGEWALNDEFSEAYQQEEAVRRLLLDALAADEAGPCESTHPLAYGEWQDEPSAMDVEGAHEMIVQFEMERTNGPIDMRLRGSTETQQRLEMVKGRLPMLDWGLQRVQSEIKAVCSRPHSAAWRELKEECSSLVRESDADLNLLAEMIRTSILRGQEWLETRELQRNLMLLRENLSMLEREFIGAHNLRGELPLTLVIEKQPFPATVRQENETKKMKKQLNEGELVVRLVTGATVDVVSMGAVTCKAREVDGKEPWDDMLLNNTQTMHGNTCSFPLVFTQASWKKLMEITFSVTVEFRRLGGDVQKVRLVSSPTCPFIATSGSKPWSACCEKLFLRDMFGPGGDNVIQWTHFSNYVAWYTLAATHQTNGIVARQLSDAERDFIRKKFFHSCDFIDAAEATKFWKWYGPTMQKVRYQHNILEMYLRGLVHWSISREGAEEVLRGRAAGTCVIRLSNSYPGEFAVSYVNLEGVIRPYKVPDNDISGAKITLADAVLKWPELTTIMVLRRGEWTTANIHEELTCYRGSARSTAVSDYDDHINDCVVRCGGGSLATTWPSQVC